MKSASAFLPVTATAVLALASTTSHAQSVFMGRVLTDSGVPLNGAEVFLNGPQNTQRTDARGEFRFMTVPAGEHIVGVRMPGFAPSVDTIEVADAGEVRREYKLARIEATLPKVPVTTTMLERRLFDFNERRRFGIGRFLDSAQFANMKGTRTSDRLAALPGIRIERGRGTEAFVTNTRVRSPGEPGSRSWCRAMVWLDGVIKLGTGINVNEFDPSIIAAVEWYAGEASVPIRFAVPQRPERYCGVLVIWTR